MTVKFVSELEPSERIDMLGNLFIQFCALFTQEEDPHVQRQMLENLRVTLPEATCATQEVQRKFCDDLLDRIEAMWRDLEVINR